jgi:hemerythrin-like domain-containing protein
MAGPTESLRRLLVRDHARLAALFAKLLDAFREGDARDVRAMWARFESGLLAHFRAEERELLPAFAEVNPVEASELLAEHAVFRRLVAELGVGVDLHVVSLNVARGFVQALRAHVRREDRLFYRWAERHIEERVRESETRSDASA